jgi:hypothetical protein
MDIQEHGCPAVFLAAGECIEVVAYGVTPKEPFNICYYGERSYYDEIKG